MSGRGEPAWTDAASAAERHDLSGSQPAAGLMAAQEIRELHPDTGVLVLSHYLEPTYAMRLMEQHPQRVGYLLKERVSDIAVLADGVRRIA